LLKKLMGSTIDSSESFLDELLSKKPNYDALKKALKDKVIDVNSVDSKGNSFLHNTILGSNQESSFWLIKNGIDITLVNNSNQNVLNLAINNDDDKLMVKILQEDKINVNEKDINGRVLLQDLAVDGKNKMAKILINYGANVNSQDKHHRNVIFDALSYGDENFIIYLLTLEEPKIHLNNVDDNLNTIMHHSEVENNDEIALKLIDAGADVTIPNAKGETFLCKAALRGMDAEGLVKLALKKGANINATTKFDNTILMELMNAFTLISLDEVERRKNLLEMSKLMVAYGGDIDAVNIDQETALFQAIRAKDMDLISFLLRTGINPNIINRFGQTVLSEVIYQGVESLDSLLILLDYNVDPLIRNLKGQTIYEVLNGIILHTHDKKYIEDEEEVKKIVKNGQYMVMLKELLKNNKADLNFLDSKGNPLFFTPLLYDDSQLFRLYINNKLNIHMINKKGHNIFYEYVVKVFEDNTTKIEFQDNLSRLISKKVNHNYKDALGWTVLHKILSTPCNDKLFNILTKIIKFNFKITENLGRTVIHNAVWANNQRMIKKINTLDHEVINIEDTYGILPVTYAALLGSQELVLLFIELKAHIKGGHKIPLKAIKKFSPMLKNLPKLRENIQNPTILEEIDTLIHQTQLDFNVPESLIVY